MTFRMGDINKGPSWFFTSKDRGHTWQGPWTFPRLDLPGIAARTDYLVTGKQDALAFMTAAKSNGREGRPFVVAHLRRRTQLLVCLVDRTRAARGLRDHALDGEAR